MTAKSRVRKIQKKLRRTADVNPQPGSPRNASERAEEARDAEGGRAVAVVLDGHARIQSVSLVREGEGTGYILEVGGEPVNVTREGYEQALTSVDRQDRPEERTAEQQLLWDIFAGGSEEALREEAASDAAPLAERGASAASKQPTFFEQLHEVEAVLEVANRQAHLVFFEAEVNGQPTHVESEDCYCGQELHHWKDLGEN